MTADVDPRLLRELEDAGDDGQVEAAVLLGDSSSDHAKQVIDRVADNVKRQPQNVEIMPNLGTMIVKGSGKFVRELVAQDDVESASSLEGETNAL